MGVPIISRTIKQLIKTKIFDLIIVSTDSNKIANIARNSGAEVPFLRPKKFQMITLILKLLFNTLLSG